MVFLLCLLYLILYSLTLLKFSLYLFLSLTSKFLFCFAFVFCSFKRVLLSPYIILLFCNLWISFLLFHSFIILYPFSIIFYIPEWNTFKSCLKINLFLIVHKIIYKYKINLFKMVLSVHICCT